jgi:hypothetical protein
VPSLFWGEVAKYMFLKYSEMKRWRELVCTKWLSLNKNVTCRKGLTCTNVMELKNTGQYLLTFRWQWKNEVNKGELKWEAVVE